jgi:predicted MPP superfamily phosphohydrolase
MNEGIPKVLEKRLGRAHAKLRLGVEAEHEAQVFGQGINFFHIENLRSSDFVIPAILKLVGLYRRGCVNATQIQIKRNYVKSTSLPKVFDGFVILHLSDLHVDVSRDAMERLTPILEKIDYDLCVLTGDYRGETFGPCDETIAGMARICAALRKPIYGVLGNHDTIRMLPDLEQMGIRMLVNECEIIKRDGKCIYLSGIDDAHFYLMDNIEKAASGIPGDAFSILLSHTPEVYEEAANVEFNLMLSGHTHGGQICLPGGIPIILNSVLPRYMGSGAWTYRGMSGYTSVGAGSSKIAVRFNCPPEITLHYLHAI